MGGGDYNASMLFLSQPRSGEGDTQRMAKEYKVGDQLIVRLNYGRIVEAKIRAAIDSTEGVKLQVDYGTMKPR